MINLIQMISTMDSQKRTENLRKDMVGVLAILLGLAIGLFIRRIKIGLIIGIVLGLVAVMLLKRK